MYWEILVVAVIIFLVSEYSGIVSTGKFIQDYQSSLMRFKESDYDFLLKARYGADVSVEEMYNKRLRYAFIALAFSLFFLITNMSYIMIILAIGIAISRFKEL